MPVDLPSPLAVVCHDAGSANIIFSWLKRWNGEVLPVLRGPAAALWKSSFPDKAIEQDLASALSKAEMLLSGTSWLDRLEHEARIHAADLKLRSVAVIDHWVNYTTRFQRDCSHQLPDEIWVTDQYAADIATRTFPRVPVFVQPDTYVQDQIANILPPPRKNIFLYLLEPVATDWGMNRAGEFVALDYAIDRLSKDAGRPTLKLRPHPSESPDKYAHYIETHDFIAIDDSTTVGEAISKADAVVGVESFALTIALGANRPVFCSLPPGAPAFRLPHTGIREMRKTAVIRLN